MLKFDNRVSAIISRRLLLSSLAGIALAVTLGALPGATFAANSAANSDEFFKLVQMNDYRRLPKLLASGMNPNVVESKRGETGLMLAIREESMNSFEVLLNARGIDLNLRARNGDTALMVASYKGNVSAVKSLLAKEAEPNTTGWTALHYAAAIGNDEIVQLLLDASAYIDAGSPNQTTPLMMAAREGKILTVKLLLDSGADARLKNDVGMNAIDFARKFDHEDIAVGLTSRLNKASQK